LRERSRGRNARASTLARIVSAIEEPVMSTIERLPGRALELATQVGEGIKSRVPDRALQWVETGAAIGAVKTGAKVATKFVRRNPAVAVAAIAGAGLLWYAARRRAKQAEEGPIEGRSRRVEARRGRGANGSGGKSRTRHGTQPVAD
jgi:lysozyme family protein